MLQVDTEEKWKKATFFNLPNPGKVIKKLSQPHQEFDKKISNLHKQSQFIN